MSPAEIGWNMAIPHPKCRIFLAYWTPKLSPRGAMVVATEVDGAENVVGAPCWEEDGDPWNTCRTVGWMTRSC